MEHVNERNLILELCKFKDYNMETLENYCNLQLDEPYLLGQLLFHRLGGIAYGVLRESEFLSKFNRETRNSLEIIYEGYKVKTESFIKSLEYVSDIINKVDFPFALLKGSQLVQVYPIGYRTSNDIDILILDQDIMHLSSIFEQNNFKQGKIINNVFQPAKRSEIIYSRMNKGEIVPYIKEINLPWMKYLEIDVNFSLDYKAKNDEDGKHVIQNILLNVKPLTQNLYTLSNDDFLIHLCTHLYKEATTYPWVKMRRDISLYKFCDIYNLLNIDEFKSKSLASRINTLNLQKECYYSFYYTKHLFKLKNSFLESLLEEIKPEDQSFMNRIIVPGKEDKFFNADYSEWVFMINREKCLKDVN